MRRSRVPSNGPGRFFAAQFSAGCTTNMSGFDFDRQWYYFNPTVLDDGLPFHKLGVQLVPQSIEP
jgi:hypothetical protein